MRHSRQYKTLVRRDNDDDIEIKEYYKMMNDEWSHGAMEQAEEKGISTSS